MAKLFNQFLLLSWKNWKLQGRKKIATILEIGVPVFFAIILLGVRQIDNLRAVEYPDATKWDTFTVDEFNEDLEPPGVQQRWNIAFTPGNAITKALMTDVRSKLGIMDTEVIFNSEDEMVEFFGRENPTTLGFIGGIVFHSDFPDDTTIPKNMTYTIRLKAEQQFGLGFALRIFSASDWFTSYQFPLSPSFGPRQLNQTDGGRPGYLREGFLPIQRALDLAIISLTGSGNNGADDIKLYLQRHPYPSYVMDPFIVVLQSDFTFIIMISFIVVAPNIVKDVVLEKERKLRETMKMMGLKLWLNWLSWLIKYLLFCVISVTLMTFLFHIDFGQGAVINYSDPSVTFVFLLLYAFSVIMFSFMVSSFFSKASNGAAGGGILFFVFYMPYYFYQFRYDSLSIGTKVGGSFFMNVAMSFGCVQYANYEARGVGLQWHNIGRSVSVDDNFSMAIVWTMFLVDSLVYGLIAWYLDALFPGEYGLPQKFYFPFTKSYWCGVDHSKHDIDLHSPVNYGDKAEYFEQTTTDLNSGICIRQLRKDFKKNGVEVRAVNDMNLDMYEGQITALLGHNGAGKTTTMFMLTGFLPPTSGTATVNGYDIRSDMEGVRSSLGLCPQHDVLFDDLTVKEHLVFFSKLKGCTKVDSEVDRMISLLHLEDKTDALSSSLSGGMKRKLCVGIALIGGSKVVILDEPTSGMDPEARRKTWDILQAERKGRTMILSTHFMDEADFLGDRIAIMAEGDVQCYGTSMFLKNKFGVGYNMVIVKGPDCDVKFLTGVITSYVSDAKLKSNVGSELSFMLPKESSHSFEGMFEHLENNKSKLGILSYGSSITTMEEVFITVGEKVDQELQDKLANQNPDEQGATNIIYTNIVFEGDDEEDPTPNGKTSGHTDLEKKTRTSAFGVEFEVTTGASLYMQQFMTMLRKRAIYSWRSKLVSLAQLLVPLFFVLIGCLVIVTLPGPRDPPDLLFTLDNYREPSVPYMTVDTDGSDTADILSQIYAKQMSNYQTLKVDDSLTIEDYLEDVAESKFEEYMTSHMTATTFMTNTTDNGTSMIGSFNNEAYHAIAVITNILDNTLLHLFTSDDRTIQTHNHPLPRVTSNKIEEEYNTAQAAAFIVAYNSVFGLSFLIGTFAIFLIKERAVKSKHNQFVSGVGVTNYWFSTLLWDMANFTVPVISLIIVYVAFGIDGFVESGNWLRTFLIFMLFAWASLPMVYLLSFIFSVPSSGYVWITMLNIFLGTVSIIVVSILYYPSLDVEHVAVAMDWIFTLMLPSFLLQTCMQSLYTNHEVHRICGDLQDTVEDITAFCDSLTNFNITNGCCQDNCGDDCFEFSDNYFAWEKPGIGRGVTFLVIQGFLYWTCIIVVESQTIKRWSQKFTSYLNTLPDPSQHEEIIQAQEDQSGGVQDQDVLNEKARVSHIDVHTDTLILRNINKYYGAFRAVDKLCVGIPQGECFGLLGVNGAGKTTTFKMLTGDETISGGEAFINGYNVSGQIKQVRNNLGYCPQFDALIDIMTVKETLQMYATLRGIKAQYVDDIVDSLIQTLLLEKHVDKLAGNLSGGNKRKLSTAIALIGDPTIVFLDEPTTGMDPVARRMLWNALTKVRLSGRTLVLTSHSMEECEALCTRLAIMVNGQFKCLGSTQHLKNNYGEGYTLMAKISSQVDDVDVCTKNVQTFIENQFPGCELKDIHHGYVHYQIMKTHIKWAQIFGIMENAKNDLFIEDYSVSQTTLDQIFLNFARVQVPPIELKLSCTTKSKNCMKFCCCCGCCTKDEINHEDEQITVHTNGSVLTNGGSVTPAVYSNGTLPSDVDIIVEPSRNQVSPEHHAAEDVTEL